MTPHTMRAVAPPGSIATRAGRRDVGQSLSNVVFQGTVLRVREVPGDVATRYSYDVRVQIGRSEATRVTIAGARASESQPGGLELSTPEFHPGDQVSCYRVSRSEWIVTGREPQNKADANVSLAVETGRAVLTMDTAGFVLAGSERRSANAVASDAANLELASGVFPSAGVHAALLRLSASGAVVEHITGESGRLSWSDGVLALATSGSNHERDRLSIPVLIEDSDAKRQKYRYYSVADSPMSQGLALDAAPDPGMRGKTAGADPDNEGVTLDLQGSTATVAQHSHGAGSLEVVRHTHKVGELETIVDINSFVGRLGAVSVSNHMVETQSDLAPEQTVSDPVEVRSAGSAQWRFLGRDARLSWARAPSSGNNAALVALLGGQMERGASVLTAIRALLVQNFIGGFRSLPNLEPGSHFPDLSDPERRRRMAEIGALRTAAGHLVYNDNVVLSSAASDGLGFIAGEEDGAIFRPNLPALTVDDAANGSQRTVVDDDVTYRVLGVAVLPAPNALENEIIAPDEEPIFRYLWAARLKPKLWFAR